MKAFTITIGILLGLILLPLPSQADSLGIQAEQEIQAVQNQILKSQKLPSAEKKWLEAVLKKTKSAQCYGDFESCIIYECEVSPKNCRKDHVLLFRGEELKWGAQGLSSLVYTKHSGSEYAEGLNAIQTLQRLHDDVQTLKCDHQLHDNEIYLYKRSGFENVWLKSDHHTELTCEHGDIKHLTPLQQIYLSHKMESHLMYRDQRQQKFLNLNPFVAFSAKPDRALEFAGTLCGYDSKGVPSHLRSSIGGRLIVLSVPKSELKLDCRESMPLPGEVMRTDRCFDTAEPFHFEDELVATLYPNPQYIYKIFEIPKADFTPSN